MVYKTYIYHGFYWNISFLSSALPYVISFCSMLTLYVACCRCRCCRQSCRMMVSQPRRLAASSLMKRLRTTLGDKVSSR